MSPEPNADVVEHSQVVIIGAGQAGVQFADSLREAGHQGAVTILEQEDVLPYQRPPLSKDHLSEGAVPGAVPLRAVDFYPQKDIVLRGGAQALAVDRANQRVALSDGTTVSYTTLVFATGAANRVLTVRGSDLAGVHGLRTQRDADRVRDELSRAHSVVVVGAGFVGLEFAPAGPTSPCSRPPGGRSAALRQSRSRPTSPQLTAGWARICVCPSPCSPSMAVPAGSRR
jgi:3-phenylpropionate/trans-cinnamate dioxygenase ferredoxin reductase subunit